MPQVTGDRDHLTNHWTRRPGWTEGRALLACYVTVQPHAELVAAAQAAQRALDGVPRLDLVQGAWLHATVQGIGFLDTLPAGAAERFADGLRPRLAALRPPRLEAEPARVGIEAVSLPLTPADELAAVRQAVRDTAADDLGVLEPYVLPGQGSGFRPHVSIAYANGPVPVAELRRRLGAVPPVRARCTVDRLSLLALRQVGRSWQWVDEERLPVGAG